MVGATGDTRQLRFICNLTLQIEKIKNPSWKGFTNNFWKGGGASEFLEADWTDLLSVTFKTDLTNFFTPSEASW